MTQEGYGVIIPYFSLFYSVVNHTSLCHRYRVIKVPIIVPGFTDPADIRIQNLRRPLVEQELHYKTPSTKAMSETYATSHHEALADAYMMRATSDPQLSSVERPFLQNPQQSEETEVTKDDRHLHKLDSEISQGSRKSDSGIESGKQPKLWRMEKSRQRDIKAMMGYHGLVSTEIKPSKRKFIPSAWKQFYLRRKNKKDIPYTNWENQSGDFLSWSKKWARQMLERGHYSDDDSIISSRSGDSDIEMHMYPDASPGHQLRRAFTHDSIHDMADPDLNHSYADLSDIHPSSHRGKNIEVTYTNPGFHPDDPSSPLPSSSSKKAQYSQSKKKVAKDVHVTQAFIHREGKNSEDCPSTHYSSSPLFDNYGSPTNSNQRSDLCSDHEPSMKDAQDEPDVVKPDVVKPDVDELPGSSNFTDLHHEGYKDSSTPPEWNKDSSTPPESGVGVPSERESGDGQDHSASQATSPTSHSSHGYITLLEADGSKSHKVNR